MQVTQMKPTVTGKELIKNHYYRIVPLALDYYDGLNNTDRRLLSNVYTMYMEGNLFYKSNRVLSQEIGISTRSITRCVKKVYKLGFISTHYTRNNTRYIYLTHDNLQKLVIKQTTNKNHAKHQSQQTKSNDPVANAPKVVREHLRQNQEPDTYHKHMALNEDVAKNVLKREDAKNKKDTKRIIAHINSEPEPQRSQDLQIVHMFHQPIQNDSNSSVKGEANSQDNKSKDTIDIMHDPDPQDPMNKTTYLIPKAYKSNKDMKKQNYKSKKKSNKQNHKIHNKEPLRNSKQDDKTFKVDLAQERQSNHKPVTLAEQNILNQKYAETHHGKFNIKGSLPSGMHSVGSLLNQHLSKMNIQQIKSPLQITRYDPQTANKFNNEDLAQFKKHIDNCPRFDKVMYVSERVLFSLGDHKASIKLNNIFNHHNQGQCTVTHQPTDPKRLRLAVSAMKYRQLSYLLKPNNKYYHKVVNPLKCVMYNYSTKHDPAKLNKYYYAQWKKLRPADK